jgi:hypothetical protein
MTQLVACVTILWISMLFLKIRDYRFSLPLESAVKGTEPDYPRLSVVIAACNEASTIEPALLSLLEQDYPNLELIVVNDRSTDETGEILERLASGRDLLRVCTITELPSGWLGKTHALHQGSLKATGELLLFTDADVHFEPHALRDSVRALFHLDVDHLVVSPKLVLRGFWEELMTTYFFWLFGVRFRPELTYVNKKCFVGIGAFNMVKTASYRSFGGHTSLTMQVADDLMLGKLVKKHGMRQACLKGPEVLRVRWLSGLWGIVRGLEKNSYAGLDYSLPFTLLANIGLLVLGLAPLLGMWWGGASAVWGVLCWGAMGLCGALVSTITHTPRWSGLAFPLATVIMCFIILRSAWLTEKQQGIRWRGTFYSLAELRRQETVGSRF